MTFKIKKRCRVLVTGAGSGVGQGIIKSLKISKLPITIISADIAKMNAGLFVTREAILIPKVEDRGSLKVLISILINNRVDVLLIGSEFELVFFSKNKDKIEKLTNTKIIVSPLKSIKIADDKWLTTEFLKKNGLSYAPSYLPVNIKDAINIAKKIKYPLVLKSRVGTSSRNVFLIENKINLKKYFDLTPYPMMQKMLSRPSSELNSEYTCSIFKTYDKKIIGPFTAKRTIKGGTSWNIEVNNYKNLHQFLLEIAKKFDFIGSLNVQLMLTDNGPIPFELNSRFSGTTAVRAHFGFNEPEMAIYNYFYKKNITEPKIKKGIAMRYNEEVFIENTNEEKLSLKTHSGKINKWF